jgi:hypothetical protein
VADTRWGRIRGSGDYLVTTGNACAAAVRSRSGTSRSPKSGQGDSGDSEGCRQRRLVPFDVETDGDLELIVNGMCAALPPEDILWVGSAGMAEALVSRSSPAFFVVGSMSTRSALQARNFCRRRTSLLFW